ncbi:MAG TPA: helix-turn-helix transcriptional regulator [Myxococcota bacterium]|nr:helix-turn-helix transcriptional regulator [Myxococcota bacterium]
MSQRPSEPILNWLRDTLKSKNLNVAALAEASGDKRGEVKKVLAGRQPLTVDQLMRWTQALELKLEELVAMPTELPEPAEPTVVDDSRYVVDPFGMAGEQAVRMGFAMGCDFTFLALTEQLADSGIPGSVLSDPRFGSLLPIRLEAPYHKHNAPVYDARTLALTLSFDTIRTCVFPWSAIVEVRYHVEPPDPSDAPGPDGDDDDGNVVRLFG